MKYLETLKEWIAKTRSAEEMLLYEDSLIECTKHEKLRKKCLQLDLTTILTKKVSETFAKNVEVYQEMLKFFNGVLETEKELLDFTRQNLATILDMGIDLGESMSDEIELIDLI